MSDTPLPDDRSPSASAFQLNRYSRYGLILLLLIVGWAYSNSLDCAWHWDDYPNIVFNPKVHVADLSPASLKTAMTLHNDAAAVRVFRPVAFLTLALNWHVGQLDVFGYHAVNLAIHLINTSLLYFTIIAFLNGLPTHTFRTGEIKALALVAAALWALNPVQTQAVTYIVQRMAALCTLFYLVALLAFLKARQAPGRWRQMGWAALCLAAFMLSLGSKENTVMLPVSLILIEACFSSSLRDFLKQGRWAAKLCIGAALGVCLTGILIILAGDPRALLDGYGSRAFTLTERLMTQPRIIFFYLSQLFYPLTHRLSLIHDVRISTSLFSPWTTLPAMLALVILALLAFRNLRKYPLPAFGLLFFLANHVVESTVLPLELLFEHRNYLPSLFLFTPIAHGLILVHRRHAHRGFLKTALVLVTLCVCLALGLGTHARNLDWKTAQSLWSDAMYKAPGSAAPLINLATAHYQLIRDWDSALRLNQIALTKWDATPKNKMFTCFTNIAAMHLMKKEYPQAIQFATRALDYKPGGLAAMRILGVAHYHAGQTDEALQRLDQQIARNFRVPEAATYKFKIHFKQKDYTKAREALRQRMRIMPEDAQTHYLMGITLSKSGHFRQADWFLGRAVCFSPQTLAYRLWQIENRLMAGEGKEGIDGLVAELFKHHTLNEIYALIPSYQPANDLQLKLEKVTREWINRRALDFLRQT